MLSPPRGEGAVTRLPDVLVARYRGASSDAAQRYFAALSCAAAADAGRRRGPRTRVPPRIWTHLSATRMELTPREKDKLLIFTAALLAERRHARGLQAQLSGSGRVHHAPRSWKARATAAPSPS